MTPEEKAREYLLKEHSSPFNIIMHQCDLKTEMQYHTDIENAFIKGAKWKEQQMIEKTVEWFYSIMYYVSIQDKRLVCSFTNFNELVNDFKKVIKVY